ncbi:MAG: hypothetical protein CL863_01305 [Cyanobium sp. RS427]|nr:hypothetical protein [Cyanobium sp. RS427]
MNSIRREHSDRDACDWLQRIAALAWLFSESELVIIQFWTNGCSRWELLAMGVVLLNEST